MTIEQTKIAVGECCGWEYVCPPAGAFYAYWQKENKVTEELPNYPVSLDACAEFEAELFGSELKQYIRWLVDIRQTPEDAITARPEQRCEAFLRVKGKWV